MIRSTCELRTLKYLGKNCPSRAGLRVIFFRPPATEGPAGACGTESASRTQGFTGAFQDNALDVGVLPEPGTEVPFVMG